MPVQQTSLIDARRTQNIEITLRRIPGATPEDKATFVLFIMRQVPLAHLLIHLCARPWTKM